MILTIDIGNSNIVLGGVEDQKILFEARLQTDATKTSDQYCVDLKILLEVYGVDAKQIEGTIIASVVPQVLNSVQTAVKKLTGKQCLVVPTGRNPLVGGNPNPLERRILLRLFTVVFRITEG